MKNLLNKGLVIAMMFSAILATAAGNDYGSKFTVVNSKMIDLKLEIFEGEIQVKVKDIHGETLHSEKFDGALFSKKYDLNILPKGTYYFEVEGNTKIKIIPFEVKANEIVYDSAMETVYHKPSIIKEDKFVYVSKLTTPSEEFTMTVVDDYDNVLYTETVTGPGKITKKLNLNKLDEGTYRLYVRSGSKVYTESITVKK
jgi:hypothetical protein